MLRASLQQVAVLTQVLLVSLMAAAGVGGGQFGPRRPDSFVHMNDSLSASLIDFPLGKGSRSGTESCNSKSIIIGIIAKQ